MTIARVRERRSSNLPVSGVIWLFFQVREQYLLAPRHAAPTIGFHCDEDRIDFLKRLRIIKSQDPTFIRRIVYVHHTEIKGSIPIRTPQSPRLKRISVFQPWLLVKIIGVKNQGLPFGIKNSSVRLLLLSITADVVYFGNVKIARRN